MRFLTSSSRLGSLLSLSSFSPTTLEQPPDGEEDASKNKYEAEEGEGTKKLETEIALIPLLPFSPPPPSLDSYFPDLD